MIALCYNRRNGILQVSHITLCLKALILAKKEGPTTMQFLERTPSPMPSHSSITLPHIPTSSLSYPQGIEGDAANAILAKSPNFCQLERREQ